MRELKGIDVSIAALALVALVSAVVLLGYTGRDDTHITYFVAEEMARGNGVVNYNNEAVEQSSTLLHTIVLAVVSVVTALPPAQIGPFVSFGFLVLAAIFVLPGLSGRLRAPHATVALMAPPTIYWSLSGMENSLYLFLLLLLCAQMKTGRSGPGPARGFLVFLLSGALALTRPEAPFVMALAFVIMLSCRREGRLLTRTGFAALGVALAIALRLMAGLQVFPNTVYAKQSFESISQRVGRGARYLEDSLTSLPPAGLVFGVLLLAMLYALVFRSGRRSPETVSLAAFAVSITVFSVAAGGDWMEASRFLSPAYALAGIWALLWFGERWTRMIAVAMLLSYSVGVVELSRLNVGGIPLFTRYDYVAENYSPASIEGRNVIHARDLSFVDRLIEIVDSDPRDRIVIASRQAGMVPHYLMQGRQDRVLFIDLIGLSTRHVHECRSGRHWHAHPYDDLADLEACLGIEFDFVFDLDTGRHGELDKIRAYGCEPLHVERPRIQPTPWKPAFQQTQFVARCN